MKLHSDYYDLNPDKLPISTKYLAHSETPLRLKLISHVLVFVINESVILMMYVSMQKYGDI